MSEVNRNKIYSSLPSLNIYLNKKYDNIIYNSYDDIISITNYNTDIIFGIIQQKLSKINTIKPDYSELLELCKWMILGGKPIKRINELYNEGKLYAQQCSKVWGQTELAYRCQTCGYSSASSLCVGCFKNGDHKGHDYAIYRSSFGGCCDCGNEESWNPKGNCKMHPGKTDLWPLDCIYNDPILGENKSAQTVIHILMLLMDRSITLIRNKEENIVSQYKTELDCYLYTFALAVIPWFEEIAALGDPIRCIVGLELLDCCIDTPKACPFIIPIKNNESTINFLKRVNNNTDYINNYNKSSLLCRLSAHLSIADPMINLYLQLLYDNYFKRNFMNAFIRYYPSFAPFMNNISNTKDKRTMDDFINRVTAQLWNFHDQLLTVIDNEYNVLDVLMDTLIWCLNCSIPSNSINIDCENKSLEKEYYWSFITDIITILSYKPAGIKFIKSKDLLFKKWLYILTLSFDINPNIRKLGNHIERPSQSWKTSFSYELTLSRSYEPIFSGFDNTIKELLQSDSISSLKIFIRDRIRMITERLEDVFQFQQLELLLKSQKLPNNKEIMICDYDVFTKPISFHIPLHRYLAGFLQIAISNNIDCIDVLLSKESLSRNFLELLIEHPMRIQAVCAHTNAELWVRNGTMSSQAYLYQRRAAFCDDGYDYDIFLLQILCILLGPDTFITNAIKRFKLEKIFLIPSLSSSLEIPIDPTPKIVSEILYFFINIITHRVKCGMTIDECIKRDIIHALAVEDLTYSNLQSLIYSRLTSNKNFDKILLQVSEYKEASVFKNGMYTLKSESWEYFDPFFPRYGAKERQQAKENYIKHLHSTNTLKEKGLIPNVKLYKTNNTFGSLLDLLWCPSMMYIYYIVLFKKSTSTLINESSLYSVLYLLNIAIEYAPINPISSFALDECKHNPFPHSSFDQNLSDANKLPGGSLLSQLIQLYQSKDIDNNIIINIKHILQIIAERNDSNASIINNIIIIDSNSINKDDKQSIKEKAKIRQQELLNSFKAQQEQFLNNMDDSLLDIDEEDGLLEGQTFVCVLCRDESSVQQSIDNNRPIGLTSFIQNSNLLKSLRRKEQTNNDKNIDLLSVDINNPIIFDNNDNNNDKDNKDNNNDKDNKDNKDNNKENALKNHFKEILTDIESTTNQDIRFCGHHIHMDCLYRYFGSLCQSFQRRVDYEGRTCASIPNGEFLCPSCRRLCNCVVPLVKKNSNLGNTNEDLDTSLPSHLIPLETCKPIMDIINWKQPLQSCFTIDKLEHKEQEKIPAFFTKIPQNLVLLPSAPIPPRIDKANNISEALDMLLLRASWKDKEAWIGYSMKGPYIYQLYNLINIFQERIASLEIQSRDISFSFIDFLSTQQIELQENELLLSICLSYRNSYNECNDYRKGITQILFQNICNYNNEDNNENSLDILSTNPLSILTSIISLNAFEYEKQSLYYIIGCLYVLTILQSILSIIPHNIIFSNDIINNIKNKKDILSLSYDIYHKIIDYIQDDKIENSVKLRTSKFLKQITIIFYILDNNIISNIPLSMTLNRQLTPNDKDYQQLSCILGLSGSPLATLQTPKAENLITKWIYNHCILSSNNIKYLKNDIININFKPRFIYESQPFRFIPLPHLFQEMYQHIIQQYCNICEGPTRETGICLTCGNIICAGTKHLLSLNIGPQFTEALNVFVEHSKDCGGAFLLLRLCSVLLFRGRRISVWNSIYLDDHGEDDWELKRGKALYLDKSRVNQLLQLIISQKIDHDTRVLSKTQILGRR